MTTFIALLARGTMSVPALWVVSHEALLGGAGVAAGICAVSGLLRPRPAPRAAALAAVGASILIARASFPGQGLRDVASEIHQLPVGQGDAALVVAEDGRAGLIDTGSARAVPDARWLELLARAGVTRLSWVALTHLDEDHAGALARLRALIPIDCAESAQQQWDSPRGHRLKLELSRASATIQNWGSGCVPFPTLAPVMHPGTRMKPNAAMGAVWVPIRGQGSYLSAGDAEAREEPRIAAWASRLSQEWEGHQRGQERVLEVSHHGSKTSSAPRLLELFRPTEAWISVGRGNLYGHPNPGVLDRLRHYGVPVRRTDLEGELVLRAGLRAEVGHHQR